MSDIQEQYAEVTKQLSLANKQITRLNAAAQQGLVLANNVLSRFTVIPEEDPELLSVVERAKTVKRLCNEAQISL